MIEFVREFVTDDPGKHPRVGCVDCIQFRVDVVANNLSKIETELSTRTIEDTVHLMRSCRTLGCTASTPSISVISSDIIECKALLSLVNTSAIKS